MTNNTSEFRKLRGNRIEPKEVHTERVNNVEYAVAHPGATLSEKVENALAELGGDGGRVVISNPHSGGAWEWGSGLTIDVNENFGVELDAAEGTYIEYSGDGWMVTVISEGSVGEGHKRHLSIRGGHWVADGTGDPDGCIRIKDTNHVKIQPSTITDFTNSDNDATGVSVENHDSFSEGTTVRGMLRDCDIGVDFKPASVTGGSGTGSFVNADLHKLIVLYNEIGVRLRGSHTGTVAPGLNLFPRSDDTTALLLDGRLDKMSILSPRIDDAGDGHTGVTAFETGADYVSPVLITSPSFANVDTQYSLENDSTDRINVIGTSDDRSGFSIHRPGSGVVEIDGGAVSVYQNEGDSSEAFRLVRDGRIFDFDGFQTGDAVEFRDGVLYRSQGEPSTPSDGAIVYIDSNDGELKAKDDTGTVSTIATF